MHRPPYQLLFFLTILALQVQAQKSGILLVKKKDRVVQRFFKNNFIAFYTPDGYPVNGNIDSITTDSIFITHVMETMVPTGLGTFRKEIMGSYPINMSIANIGSFPQATRKGSGLIRGGKLFMIGGAAYTALNLFNTIRDGDPPFGNDNLPKLLAGIGTFGVGYLLSRLRRSNIVIGKKYSLQVIPP